MGNQAFNIFLVVASKTSKTFILLLYNLLCQIFPGAAFHTSLLSLLDFVMYGWMFSGILKFHFCCGLCSIIIALWSSYLEQTNCDKDLTVKFKVAKSKLMAEKCTWVKIKSTVFKKEHKVLVPSKKKKSRVWFLVVSKVTSHPFGYLMS